MNSDGNSYRQILDHVSEIVYQVEGNPLTGTVVFVSAQVEEILGYRAEEFIQDSNLWFQLLHPEDVRVVVESTQQIIATRAKGIRVYRLRHKGRNEYLWVEDKAVPQVDAQGQVTGIWGVARDITARQRQEAQRLALCRVEEAIWRMDIPDDIEQVLGAMREALEMARVPFQTCGVNVVDTTSEPTQISTYNTDGRASWKGMSLPGAEVILQIWRAGIPAYRRDLGQEDPYQERANIERSFGHPVRSVLDIPFARGTLAINSPQPEAFSDAHIAFLQELAQVLSEGFRRLEDLQRLAHSEARYRALVEAPNWVVGRVDQQGHCVYISPQIEAWTGYAPEEFYGDPGLRSRTIHPEDVARVEHTLRCALQGDTLQEVEFRWVCKRGDLRWVSAAAFPIYDQAKNAEGVQVVLQDITTRKEAEQAKEQAERALEEHRTMTVRTDRLRFLGQMAAGMAHELNQPLQGVRGQAEHLLIGMERGWMTQKAQLREKLQSIIAQADRMAHIIEHLRVFAREAGRPTRRLVQVGEVVRVAASLLEAQFRSRGVEMEFDLGTTPLLVSANPFSLEEVLLNLLTNARDAVEEQGVIGLMPPPPQIVVRAWAEGEGAVQQIRVEVLDQGVGISAAILGQVYDPFFTTKSPDRGTGLGLSICKALVEEVGGRIAIQSTLGQGARVSLSLPAAGPQQER